MLRWSLLLVKSRPLVWPETHYMFNEFGKQLWCASVSNEEVVLLLTALPLFWSLAARLPLPPSLMSQPLFEIQDIYQPIRVVIIYKTVISQTALMLFGVLSLTSCSPMSTSSTVPPISLSFWAAISIMRCRSGLFRTLLESLSTATHSRRV